MECYIFSRLPPQALSDAATAIEQRNHSSASVCIQMLSDFQWSPLHHPPARSDIRASQKKSVKIHARFFKFCFLPVTQSRKKKKENSTQVEPKSVFPLNTTRSNSCHNALIQRLLATTVQQHLKRSGKWSLSASPACHTAQVFNTAVDTSFKSHIPLLSFSK